MKTTSTRTVGLIYPLSHHDIAQTLNTAADVLTAEQPTTENIAELVRQVDGIIARGPARLTKEHLAGADNLRVIVTTGSGTNHIDVAAATERGIPVISGTGVAPYAVAEYALGGLIACQRNFVGFHRELIEGGFDWSTRARRERPSLHRSIVGIIGYGQIAQSLARMVRNAFDAEVLAYDPYVDTINVPHVTLVDDLDELLDRSAGVSVHVPLTASTRLLLGREELRRIGPSGCLVDSSRGGVVDAQALLESLRDGSLGAACIDVFETEPPSPEFLDAARNTPNIIVTPHLAGITATARYALEDAAVTEVLRVLDGQPPRRVVNPTYSTIR